MAKKYKVRKIKGTKCVEEIKADHDRPLFPRPGVFRDKTKYNRKRLEKIEY